MHTQRNRQYVLKQPQYCGFFAPYLYYIHFKKDWVKCAVQVQMLNYA